MIDATWTDDDIIAKLHQDFSSLSTMNKAREELKSSVSGTLESLSLFHLQIQTYAFPLHRNQGREGNSPICYYRVHFSTGTSAQQGCSEETQMLGTSPVPWRKSSTWQNSAPERCRRPICWVIPLH